MQLPNLSYFRSLSLQGAPEFGARMYQVLQSIVQKTTNTEQQSNANPDGPPSAPPKINGIQVSGQDGHIHVAITDNNEIYRGVRYYVEHADNPNFTNPQIVPMHDARNVTFAVGNQTRYVRAYSSYASSQPSDPVYHGGTQPLPVSGGGSGPGPAFLASQGSGTGPTGVGLQGPGHAPFRSVTGAPPVR